MKATVTVSRTGFAMKDIDIEIPDSKLFRVAKGGKKVRLRKAQIDKLIEDTAIDQAGDHSYTEHSSEYSVEGMTIRPQTQIAGRLNR